MSIEKEICGVRHQVNQDSIIEKMYQGTCKVHSLQLFLMKF